MVQCLRLARATQILSDGLKPNSNLSSTPPHPHVTLLLCYPSLMTVDLGTCQQLQLGGKGAG